MAKYSMGIDFGTLSGRAVIADIETGKEIATSVCFMDEYKELSEYFAKRSKK